MYSDMEPSKTRQFLHKVLQSMGRSAEIFMAKRRWVKLIGFLLAAFFLSIVGLLISRDVQNTRPKIPVVYQSYLSMISPEEITDLSIDWKNGDVEIFVQDDNDQIVIREFSELRLNRKRRMQILNQDGRLELIWNNDGFWWRLFGKSVKDLRIELPRSMVEQLVTVECENYVGDMKLRELQLQETNLKTVYGNLSFEDSRSEHFTAYTKTGDIRMSSLDSNTLILETSTGDIEGKDTITANAMMESDLGNILVSGILSEGVEMKTISGNIQVFAAQCPMNMVLKSVRGEVNVKLPPEVHADGILLNYSSVFGHIDLMYPVHPKEKQRGEIQTGAQKHHLTITTTAGAILVHDLETE